jgi:serine/threonine protein kinase
LIKKEPNGKLYLHLIDFGLAKNIKDTERLASSASRKGTDAYIPPEAHIKNPNITKQDVWAIGIIAY